MSGYMDLYEESSDSDLDDFIDYMSNIHRSIKNSKSPRQYEQVSANNENNSVIDGAISRDKITANNAKKQPILKESLRLRQNNVNCKDKENECITRFITQVTHLSTENQSYSTRTSQKSTTTMRLMTLRLDNMLEQMENRCQEKLKLYVDKAFSDAIDKIKTINNEGVNTNMSAIENTAIQEPSKRKVPKKDNDNWNTRRTWSEKVGNVKKVLYLVGLDVRKVVIVNTRKFLVSINRAPDENLCQFLDIHMNIDTLAQDLFNP
uniref:Non-structural maintenance of chromosomes element 4 n=1 Tax=Strongyloides venezuelensis TaxID=75913 RepID=A0A0K0FZM3_STRVS